MGSYKKSEEQVESMVFVLNDFVHQDYPLEEMKAAIALGKKVELVYTTPYLPPVVGLGAEFFRILSSIKAEAEMTLTGVNEVLGLPLSNLHILSPGETRSFCKRAKCVNKGGILASIRTRARVACASTAPSKFSWMRCM